MQAHELNDDNEIIQAMQKHRDSVESFDAESVHVETKNTQMSTLIQRIENDEINFAPEFQRSNEVWDDVRQSRLIESMMLRIPLPVFYMDASNDGKWEIVDGLQRLNTIKRFVVKDELELTGLQIMRDRNGQRFSELGRELQRRITEADIVIHQIRKETPEPAIYEIFNRINTGGTPLSTQEIRHALNKGPVLKYLDKLAESKEFREATDNGVSTRRMGAQECVLRFLAFTFLPPENYNEHDMNSFLVRAMKVGNRLSRSKMDEYEALFLRAMQVSYKIFDKYTFRKKNQNDARATVNKALFEAVSVNIGRLNNTEQQILIEKRAQVLNKMFALIDNDKLFEKSISGSTASVKSVRYRFQKVADMFREIINSHAK